MTLWHQLYGKWQCTLLHIMMGWWWCVSNGRHRYTIIMCVEFHSHLIKWIVFCWVVCWRFVRTAYRRPLAFPSPNRSLFLSIGIVRRKVAQGEFSIQTFPSPPPLLFQMLFVCLFCFCFYSSIRSESVKQCCAIYSNILKLLFVMTVQCSFTWSPFPWLLVHTLLLPLFHDHHFHQR